MSLNHKLLGLLGSALLLAACSDDTSATGSPSESSSESSASDSDMSGSESASDSVGDGDGDDPATTNGDGDGDTPTGDGDGDTPTGDGDGDTAGDGDGDTSGDGDGDTSTGDGDGDTSGDGDGDTTTGDGDGDPVDCGAQQAAGMGPCDQDFGWAWNGAQCVNVSGCNCVGADCNALFMDPNQCEAAYADCEMPAPGCADFDLQQCEAAFECMPLNGLPLVELPNDQQCLGQSEFIACADAGFCGGALTWACDGQGNSVWFFSTCIPESWEPCPGPQDLPECP